MCEIYAYEIYIKTREMFHSEIIWPYAINDRNELIKAILGNEINYLEEYDRIYGYSENEAFQRFKELKDKYLKIGEKDMRQYDISLYRVKENNSHGDKYEIYENEKWKQDSHGPE